MPSQLLPLYGGRRLDYAFPEEDSKMPTLRIGGSKIVTCLPGRRFLDAFEPSSQYFTCPASSRLRISRYSQRTALRYPVKVRPSLRVP